jgi:isoleucyl-tRNA synthetase
MTKYQYEEDILKFWNDNNIQEKVNKILEKKPLFNTIDGPPFPTGEIHVGHVRNWSIKDTVMRFKRFQGYNVYARDGYDVHGLPVENKVQNKLNLITVQQLKDFGEEKFVKECKNHIKGVIDTMTERRERYGLSMSRDYYHTSHPEYVSLAWRFFKKAHEKGLLYKDYKTVAWCPNDETTLSDYEVKDEYKTLVDPSIYVKFELQKPTTKYKESFVIWTTTPWTLQSNLAIAMNPKFEYAKVLVELNSKKEVLILGASIAEQVVEKLSAQCDIKFIEILETKTGMQFEGEKYHHFYLDETPSQKELKKESESGKASKFIHSIIMADYVTLDEGEDILEKLEKKGNYKHKQETSDKSESEKGATDGNEAKSEVQDGTGLVHIAPGHGQEDYDAAQKYGLPTFCPVGPDGKFTEGKYEGMYFKDVNPIAVDYLREKGNLLSSEDKSHRYPCCWRCKTPIVYRAAEQWFIRRSDILDDIVKENSNVKWFPEFAKTLFNNLTKGAGDWAISRQRYWGIPLPIFEDVEGNFRVFESKEELELEVGKKLDDIHRDDLKDLEITLENGNKAKAVPFIADVWFDSGCASFASHYGEGLDYDQIIEKYYPIKWITEGQDQVRGWFSSLFNVGHVLTGKAPYNQVLYQQFIMAKDGAKMSKSLGNGIDGNEAIEKYGADATRFYLLTKRAPEDQLNFNEEELTQVFAFFNTLENVVKFSNAYLESHDYKFTKIPSTPSLSPEDKWILHSFNTTLDSFVKSVEHYRLHTAFKDVERFIVEDFSKTYLKLVKSRTEDRDENLLAIISYLLKNMLVLLGSAIPFKTEQLYQSLNLDKESLFMEELPKVDTKLIKQVEKEHIHTNFEVAQELVQSILNSREKVKIGVRWALPEVNIVSSNSALSAELKVFEPLVQSLTNIEKVSYDTNAIDMDFTIKPNFPELKKSFGNPGPIIGVVNKNKNAIITAMKKGEVNGIFDEITLEFDTHLLKEMVLPEELISSDFSQGSVILHTEQSEELLAKGYVRELLRRIQDSRKELGYNKADQITISFHGSEQYFLDLIEENIDMIMKKTGLNEVVDSRLEKSFNFDIKAKTLILSFD